MFLWNQNFRILKTYPRHLPITPFCAINGAIIYCHKFESFLVTLLTKKDIKISVKTKKKKYIIFLSQKKYFLPRPKKEYLFSRNLKCTRPISYMRLSWRNSCYIPPIFSLNSRLDQDNPRQDDYPKPTLFK